ncbi:hypothetical protein AB6A40_008215 [Gnathostoma spinigerum]|uniref:Uncharacterized protein n=1 Tax=Gnathostoma spinigerum TaxID=75299 RepID=A0ABD6EVK8_9BILA
MPIVLSWNSIVCMFVFPLQRFQIDGISTPVGKDRACRIMRCLGLKRLSTSSNLIWNDDGVYDAFNETGVLQQFQLKVNIFSALRNITFIEHLYRSRALGDSNLNKR